jgi:hypothetical protein
VTKKRVSPFHFNISSSKVRKLGQLAANLQRFLKGLARLVHPVLVTMKNPQVVQRHCQVGQNRFDLSKTAGD